MNINPHKSIIVIVFIIVNITVSTIYHDSINVYYCLAIYTH